MQMDAFFLRCGGGGQQDVMALAYFNSVRFEIGVVVVQPQLVPCRGGDHALNATCATLVVGVENPFCGQCI